MLGTRAAEQMTDAYVAEPGQTGPGPQFFSDNWPLAVLSIDLRYNQGWETALAR